MQTQHACNARLLFNVPKGDTRLTYFWWAKFFICRGALALFGQMKRLQRDKWNNTGPAKICMNYQDGPASMCHLLPMGGKYNMCFQGFADQQLMSNCVQQPEAKKGLQQHSLKSAANKLSPGLHWRKNGHFVEHNFYISWPGNPTPCNRDTALVLQTALNKGEGWSVRFPFSVRSINRCRYQNSGWVLTIEERNRGNKDLGNTYRIEVQSESRFLVLIHPWHTCAAHFRQPAAPHQQCHLWKLTSSSDGRTKIDSYCVVHTAIATCPAVPAPLRVVIKRDKCSVAVPSCLSHWLYCL